MNPSTICFSTLSSATGPSRIQTATIIIRLAGRSMRSHVVSTADIRSLWLIFSSRMSVVWALPSPSLLAARRSANHPAAAAAITLVATNCNIESTIGSGSFIGYARCFIGRVQ